MFSAARRKVVALAFLLGALAGCDGTDSGTLSIENVTDTEIWFVHYSDCEDLDWGEDRLGETEVIAVGATRSFDVDAGCYDLKVRFADGAWQERLDVEIAADTEFTWQVID